MNVLLACMSEYQRHAWYGGQKSLGPLELEFQMDMSPLMCAGNQTQMLLTTEPSPQAPNSYLNLADGIDVLSNLSETALWNFIKCFVS